jgi:hypothetical protein
MIYWGFNGNYGWYDLWCYGHVVIDREWHYRRGMANSHNSISFSDLKGWYEANLFALLKSPF